jgi:hypothetical protein
MKSAYELAMERFGKPRELTDVKKRKLAEVDSRYEARKAELHIASDDKLKQAAGNREAEETVREQLTRELRRLEEKKEAEKEKIRDG